MRSRWLTLCLLLMPLRAGAAPQDPDVRIEARADEQMRKMSQYMSDLHSFRFQADSSDEWVATDGQRIQFLAEQEVAVKRPNHVRTDRRDARMDAVLRYDGKQLSIYGKKSGFYGVAPAPPELSDAIDFMRGRYGIEAPAADLLLDHPYDELMENVVAGRYIGLESIDGVPVHHLAFRGKDVDFQIWIQDGKEPVPRRYTITSVKEKGQPEFTILLSKWQPNARIADSEFAFTPPPGAKRIEIQPTKNYRAKR